MSVENCIKCNFKELYFEDFCRSCFLKNFVKKVRKEIRLNNMFNKSDKIAVLDYGNCESKVLINVISSIFDTKMTDFTVESVQVNDLEVFFQKIKDKEYDKLVVPNTSRDYAKRLILSFFNDDSLIVDDMDLAVFPFANLTRAEVYGYAECKDLCPDCNFGDGDFEAFMKDFDAEGSQAVRALKKSYDLLKGLMK